MQRRRAAIAAGAGMSHEEIAIGLGIHRDTLEKYFGHELSVGANRRRLDVLDAMYTAAEKGNVAAQKAYLAQTPHVAAPPLQDEKPKPEGKRAQAAADATVAHRGTEWEDDLKPRGTLQ